jgi:hypothetical protein
MTSDVVKGSATPRVIGFLPSSGAFSHPMIVSWNP